MANRPLLPCVLASWPSLSSNNEAEQNSTAQYGKCEGSKACQPCNWTADTAARAMRRAHTALQMDGLPPSQRMAPGVGPSNSFGGGVRFAGGGPSAALRPPLLVLVRGESFRANGGQHVRKLKCSDESKASVHESTVTHRSLFEELARSFDIALSLHTYQVEGCSISDYYTGWAPRIEYYNHSANNQSSLWKHAWTSALAVDAPRAPFVAALALRFDLAFRDPRALGERLTREIWGLAQPSLDGPGSTTGSSSAKLWVPHAVAFHYTWVSLSCAIGTHSERLTDVHAASADPCRSDYYFCQAYASQESEKPFLADSFQLVSPRAFGLMAALWPGHDAHGCLLNHSVSVAYLSDEFTSPSPEECYNSLYYLTGRAVSSTRCSSATDDTFYEACSQYLNASTSAGLSYDERLSRLKEHLVTQPTPCDHCCRN